MPGEIYLSIGTFMLCFIFYLNYRIKHWRFYKLINTMPGPATLPFFGNGLLFIGDLRSITDKLEKMMKQNTPLFRLWFGPEAFVVLLKPNHVQIVLNSPNSLDKSEPVRHIGADWPGDCLLVSKVPKWKRHRKIIVSTFNKKILESFMPIFVNQSEKMNQCLRKELVSNNSFDIFNYVSRATLDTICATAMGVNINSQDFNSPYFDAVLSEIKIMAIRGLKIWLHPDFIFYMTSYGKQHRKNVKILKDFSNKVIAERKNDKFRNENLHVKHDKAWYGKNIFYKPFLDLLIELTNDKKSFTEKSLQEEVDVFIFGGYETTAITNSYVILCMAANQDVQQKVYDECNEIFGTSNRSVTLADLSRMTYLEQVIKETMRLFPTVPILIREISSDIKLDNYTLPAGSSCLIPIIHLHRDPKFWTNPNQFNPDRFLPQNMGKINSGSYIPFSSGPRNCIGYKYAMMAMKTLLSTFVRSYQVHTNVKLERVQNVFELTLKLQGSYMVTLKSRTGLSKADSAHD